jgi:hypothetical protein
MLVLPNVTIGAFSLKVAPGLFRLFAALAMAIDFLLQFFLGSADAFSAIIGRH